MVISLLALLACDGKSDDSKDSNPTPADDSGTGSGSGSGDDSGTGPPVLAGACENGTRIGGVELSHQFLGFAYVAGLVEDAPYPTSKLTPLETGGGCTMMRKENPYCDPGCAPNFTCSLEGECVPFPRHTSVGTIEVTGAEYAITMEPRKDLTYWDQDAVLPIFEPGAAITLTATGDGKVPAYELHGTGVDELTILTKKLIMAEGKDLPIGWDPPTTPDAGSIYITLAIDQHGATPVTLYCEVPDTGSLDVPSKFVDTLIQYGVSGFPAAYVYRRTMDHVDTPLGCIDFNVNVQQEPFLGVVGHTPCFSDANCPKEQHCNIPTQTCVDDE